MQFKHKNFSEILVGAHVSIQGGVHNALLMGKDLGASVIQIFTANQRQWHSELIDSEEILLWEKTLEETKISHVMSHDSYLINLASPTSETLEKSKKAFFKEIERCHQLNITYLTFHPGSRLDAPLEKSLDVLVDSLLSFASLIGKGSTELLLEITAGQGSNLGSRFEEIAYVLKRTSQYLPIGVCFDTCHAFASGYDLRTQKTFTTTFDLFDQIIGIKYLKAFHCNDSKEDFGSHRDLHASLGEGKIGKDCFNRTKKMVKRIGMMDAHAHE